VSEEVASAAPAPAPAAAPAEAAPASAPVSAPAQAASTEAPASGGFAWDSWDGAQDTVPEEHRSAYDAILGHLKSDFKGREEEIDGLRAMYAAMLNEEDDPRIGDLTKKLEELQSKYDTRETEFTSLRDTHEKFVEHSAGEYVDRFWKEHEELAQDPAKLGMLIDLLEEKNDFGGMWEGYAAAQLLALPESAMKIAIEAKKDGVSDTYALKLAKAHAELEEAKAQPSPQQVRAQEKKARAEAKAKAPRTGAKITNGATTASSPRTAKPGMGDATSLDDLRNLAARRALRVHGGGRS
jgi:hypothetical protein